MNIIEHIKPVQIRIATDSDILDPRGKNNLPQETIFFPSLVSVPCVSHSQRESKAFTCHLQLCLSADRQIYC